jgi:serine phosphatase RsbU (regulator of sigma subunit)
MWTPKIPFFQKDPAAEYRCPVPTIFPKFQGGQIAALYTGARSGGDFFDAVTTDHRLVFMLLDIAGKREEALHIAAHVQEKFRADAPVIFGERNKNDAEGVTELLLNVNRAIIGAVGGAHMSSAFVGSYSLNLGILFYVNAGHTPGLIKDSSGVSLLEATGLPLGLFSHATHDAQMCVMEPGSVLLLTSRGIVESKRKRKEFGIERVRETLLNRAFDDASSVCSAALNAVEEFMDGKTPDNDLTTLALLRNAVKRSAVAGN